MGAEEKELERLRFAISVSGDAVYDWDVPTGEIIWSDNAPGILGVGELSEISSRDAFLARIDPEDHDVLAEVHARHLRDHRRFECEYRFRRQDGSYFWLCDRGLGEFGPGGEPLRVVGSVRGIEPSKQREARLVRLANYDDLTGQYNRSRLREALQSALTYSVRHGAPGAYMLGSIDNLTLINYTHGYEVADRTVMAVGRALDHCLRASDVIGRVGNDQFGIVISGCAKIHAATIAEKILNAVQQIVLEDGRVHAPVTLSIGVVTYPETVREANDAMAKAEVALEQSRRAGRNCFSLYDLSDEESRNLREHIQTAEGVQKALKEDRLNLAFQPIVEAVSGEPVFYESLLRLIEEDGTETVAGKFLPIVEQMGLARPIDRRVLEMVVAQLEAHPEVHLALNMSVLSTTDPAWLRSFTNLLEGRPGIARRLLLEITETAITEDIEEMARFVTTVRETGCRVALDDFGAGYTSFRHLQELAVDMVKIDGSFVQSLADRADSRLFVRTLQTFADGMGLKTVAECVETRDIADLLIDHGVHYLQGYLFGRPSASPPWLMKKAAAAS